MSSRRTPATITLSCTSVLAPDQVVGSPVKIVSVINYKGGVGKTTLTANLGALLADRGYRVLLVDLDPQASLTFSFFSPEVWITDLAEKRTIKQWFEEFMMGQGDTELSDLILNLGGTSKYLTVPGGRLDLIASHLRLINFDLELAIEMARIPQDQSKARYLDVHSLLADGLAVSSLHTYDIVLIDCPPNLNIVTRTAVVASDHLLVPSRADYLSTLGIHYLIEKVDELIKEYNECVRMSRRNGRAFTEIHPEVLGVVFTMVQIRNGKPIKANQEFIRRTTETLTQELQIPAFAITTRFNQGLYAETSSSGVPSAIARNVPAEIVEELNSLADEFLEKLNLEGSQHGGRL